MGGRVAKEETVLGGEESHTADAESTKGANNMRGAGKTRDIAVIDAEEGMRVGVKEEEAARILREASEHRRDHLVVGFGWIGRRRGVRRKGRVDGEGMR